MKVTTIRIPEDTYSELEDEASARSLSVSEYIREIIAHRDEGSTPANTEANTQNADAVTCQDCGYSWDYTGSMARATCPSCGAKVPVDD